MLCRTGHQLSNTILYSLTAARNLCKMARTVAIALVALLAFSMAAEISAGGCLERLSAQCPFTIQLVNGSLVNGSLRINSGCAVSTRRKYGRTCI